MRKRPDPQEDVIVNVVDALVVTLGLDASKFASGQKQASADLRKTKENANQAAKEISASGQTAAEFFGRLRNQALALFAVFVGARGLKEFTADVINSDAATGRLAHNLGMTTQALSAWQGAAERAGGSAGATGASFQSLSQDFANFAMTGQSQAVPVLRALGIAVADATGKARPLGDIMLDLADKFKGMAPEQAVNLGTRLGLDIGTINLLEQGRAAVQKLLADQAKLGTANDADAKRAQDLQNKLSDFQQALKSLGRTVIDDVLPPILRLMDRMDAWLETNREWLAAKISDEIKRVGDFLGAIDWDGIAGKIQAFIVQVNTVVDAIGGWNRVLEALLALYVVGKFAGLASGIAAVGAALNSGPVLLALAAWTAYYTAHERFAASTQTEYDDQMKGLAPGSPLWKDIPEETQRQYANSPFYNQGGESLFDRAKRWMGGGATATPTTGEQAGLSKQAMDYFTGQGWTAEQAAGIVGNLQQESSFNARAANGEHSGIAQWSAARQADIANHFGKPVSAMSYSEQLAAVQWELTEGKYKAVGKALGQSTGAGQASTIIDRGYESPGNYDAEDPKRAANAAARLAAWNGAPKPADLASGASAAQAGRSVTNSSANDNSTSVQTGPITIHTKATDAKGIAMSLGRALKDHAFLSQANFGAI